MDSFASTPTPPLWIYQRDGRLVPFDPDHICKTLFCVAENTGVADPFLMRELTDGVVYFLGQELEGEIPTTERVAEVVGKVVRELGHPGLARAFEAEMQRTRQTQPPTEVTHTKPPETTVLHFGRGTPLPAVVRGCVREWTLQEVYSRDLRAAVQDGLLFPTGLQSPLHLQSCILGSLREGEQRPLAALRRVREICGKCVVLEGLEYFLADASTGTRVEEFVREFDLGLDSVGLCAVVNLNVPTPPPWIEPSGGPLFPDETSKQSAEGYRQTVGALLDALRSVRERVSVRLHLSEGDFTPEGTSLLTSAARDFLHTGALEFVLHRPKHPTALLQGIDRKSPAVLMTVGINLPTLANKVQPENDSAVFLHKLGSLVRLAVSIGVQKRNFLRRESETRTDLTSGFLLERARLVVSPLGLENVVQRFTGRSFATGGTALDFAKQIVRRLRDVLREEGAIRRLDTALDCPHRFVAESEPFPLPSGTGCRPGSSLDTREIKSALRGCGILHALAGSGTAMLYVDPNSTPNPTQLVELLRWIREETDILSLAPVRLDDPIKQAHIEGM